jgi:hypothetical protein
MAQFTQLNLQGKPQEKPAGKIPVLKQHHLSGGQKIAAFAGSLVASTLLGVFLIQTSGCSKGNDKSARVAIASPAISSQLSAMATTPATAEPTAEKAVLRKSRQHKLSASNYTNAEYGVSFRYPKGYDLVQGDDADIDWSSLGPVEMNFVQPGGTTLTAVELPQGSYPGTDFSSAIFNVSVNTRLMPAACEQFAFPQADASKAGSTDGATASAKIEPSRVKLGAAEFTEVEDSGGVAPKKAEGKYYHIFQNGTCYEFALAVATTANKITDTPVNRNEVFRKLNWMLSTVKIEAAGVPAKVVPEVAKGSTAAPPAENKN